MPSVHATGRYTFTFATFQAKCRWSDGDSDRIREELNRIPAEARVLSLHFITARQAVVTKSQISPAAEVRAKFKRVKPLKEIGVKERGWTLDVLNVVRRLVEGRGSPIRGRWGEATDEPARGDARPTNTFATSDVYAFERELEQLHPDNRNIKAKIRQQLQELRDRNLLLHLDRNRWCLP